MWQQWSFVVGLGLGLSVGATVAMLALALVACGNRRDCSRKGCPRRMC